MVHRDAGGGSHAPREALDAGPRFEVDPATRIREDHVARHEAEARVEDLGDVGAVRRVIVEQDDAIGEHHRARSPRDDRQLAAVREHVEQLQAIEQRCDVATGDHDRLGGRDQRAHFLAVLRDQRDRGGRPGGVEAGANRPAPLDVIVIHVAVLIDGDLLLLGEQLRLHVAQRDLLRGLLGAFEARPVEALHVTQALLARLIRRRELRRVLEHVVAAGVQREVDAGNTERRDQRFVVGFALLIPRANERDRPRDPEILHDRTHVGRRALRAEQCDLLGHAAWTFTVRPTESRIWRSRS